MKLKNKKTGEIRNCQIIADGFIVINSLKDLEGWEDYEEPKEHWYINSIGGIEKTDRDENDEPGRAMIEIGNYFETKKEAEKAVEKLKAWKRLRDAGFMFVDYEYYTLHSGADGYGQIDFSGLVDNSDEIKDNLALLFGGDDE